MKTAPKVYIAGPMTGLPESNYPAFNEAAQMWRNAGWDVENPAEHFGGAQDKDYIEHVDVDIEALLCDAIALLPGWADAIIPLSRDGQGRLGRWLNG